MKINNMIYKIVPIGIVLPILLLMLPACGTITPNEPKVSVTNPVPEKQEVSIIDIPIQVELKPYFKQADAAVPSKFTGKEEHCEGTSYSYAFERSPIEFEGKGNDLQFKIDGKYALKINYCPNCTDMFDSKGSCVIPRLYASCGVGEPLRKIAIAYTSSFELLPNYQLKSTTKLKEIRPIDKCEITVFKYDATTDLLKEVKKSLKDLAGDIDKKVSETAIKQEVEKAWKSMSKPLKIDKYGYLYLQPSKISVSNFSIVGSTLNFAIAMEAYPQVELLKKEVPIPPLPNLSSYPKKEGFAIQLDLIGNYDSLSRLLSSEIKGKEIQLKKNKVILDSAKIYGAANQQLSFQISFSGKRKGTLYLVGTPTFDKEKQEISFPDLTFDLETKNALLKSAKWLFNDKITETIRKYSTYNLQSILTDAATKIEKEFNRKIDEKTAVEGKMKRLNVVSIFPLENSLLIRTNLVGKLKLTIN
jgi:hypothetical protein